jgi:hypothetical protein
VTFDWSCLSSSCDIGGAQGPVVAFVSQSSVRPAPYALRVAHWSLGHGIVSIEKRRDETRRRRVGRSTISQGPGVLPAVVRTWHHKSQVRTLVLASPVPNYFLAPCTYIHSYKASSPWPLLASEYKQTMIRTTGPRNRFVVLALLVFAGLSFLLLGPYQTPLGHVSSAVHSEQQRQSGSGKTNGAILTGHAIAPKLGNATVKYV